MATWLHTNVFTESTFLLRGHIFLTSLFNLVATELTDFDSRFFVLNVSSWSGHKQFEPLIHKGAIQVQMLPYGLVNPAIKMSLLKRLVRFLTSLFNLVATESKRLVTLPFLRKEKRSVTSLFDSVATKLRRQRKAFRSHSTWQIEYRN